MDVEQLRSFVAVIRRGSFSLAARDLHLSQPTVSRHIQRLERELGTDLVYRGITGVTLGTEQVNIIAHNTLRIPGHFHTTVAGGTSLAFMGLCYYAVPLIFQREYPARALVRWQPYLFGAGMALMAVGMAFAGSAGVPRRHWDIEFTGSKFSIGFDAATHVFLGLLGLGGVLAFTGLLLFVLLTVSAVFFGRRCIGRPMTAW
ncbi:MAG: cbb3-type cytochrome c oxidase subunit I [Deltaproteobacteria bacterium]|nr:cbb3-type cytochrome c oxidase subunit I [Deltaproteobacteria bacterium]